MVSFYTLRNRSGIALDFNSRRPHPGRLCRPSQKGAFCGSMIWRPDRPQGLLLAGNSLICKRRCAAGALTLPPNTNFEKQLSARDCQLSSGDRSNSGRPNILGYPARPHTIASSHHGLRNNAAGASRVKTEKYSVVMCDLANRQIRTFYSRLTIGVLQAVRELRNQRQDGEPPLILARRT